jgi:hypothetical protein
VPDHRNKETCLGLRRDACQIASNSDPLFASNRDPSSGAG